VIAAATELTESAIMASSGCAGAQVSKTAVASL
jgi:hypothetical protein